MAGTDFITVTPEAIVTPWEGLDELNRRSSVGPRAEVTFFVDGVSIPDPGVGDDTMITINCVCPSNFAYAFADAGVQIIQATSAANTWQDVGEISMLNAFGGGTVTRRYFTEMASNGNHLGLLSMGQAKAYCAVCPSTAIFVPQVGGDVALAMTFGNATTNHGVSTITALVRVWQYDISQANHWQPNSPVLVRS